MKEHPIATGTIGADGRAARPVTEAGRTREEQALVELGHTTFSRGVAWALTAAFLATIALVPVIQGWSALREWRARPAAAGVRAGLAHAGVPDAFAVTERIRQLVARVPTEHQLRRVETLMEQRSVVGAFVRSRVQGLLTRWFGVGNDNVYIGRDRWLFYRHGVEYVTGPAFLSPSFLARRRAAPDIQQPDPRPSILRFHDQLARRGITLVLMPTPDKIMMHPDRFYGGGDWPSMPQNPSFDRFRFELERQGVRVFDPAPALYARRAAQQLYLPADTHWMPGTAEAVAHDLAQQIKVMTRLPPMASPYQARRTDVFWGLGDLAIMLQLPADRPFVDPVTVNVRQVVSASGELWAPTPDAPVLMLGDSFCMNYENDQRGRPLGAGLAGQLSYELGQPLDRICAAGGGSYFARFLFASQLFAGARTLEHLRVVVWQFTIRELVAGDWRVIDLP